jgi:hypothetical protein
MIFITLIRFQSLLFIMVLSQGCASSHDLRKGPGPFGGGVTHSELKPGMFFVRTQTDRAPWSSEAFASSAWKKEAAKACKGKDFIEINTKLSTREVVGSGNVPLFVSDKYGYVLCAGAETSKEEAMQSAN